MIKLKIDGKEISATRGETVLAVCRREGIAVPTLCYQKGLQPYGGCRLCIVEVKGMTWPVASCTLPVSDGMEVTTDSPALKEQRKFTLQLILSEHPHSCLICAKKAECAQYMECIEKEPVTFGCKYCSRNGTCELQKLTEEFGIAEIPFEFSYRNVEVENKDPFFERDYNLCVLCGRCVRTCDEIRHAAVIDFHHRGPRTLVGTAYGMSHLEASCLFCGACVDACPTGAMSERFGKWDGKPDRVVASSCSLCSSGCDIDVNVKNDRIVSTTPRSSDLCARGRFGIAPLVNHARRATSPVMKKDGRHVEVAWDEALEFAARKISEFRAGTAVVFSPQISGEAIEAVSCFAELSGIESIGAPHAGLVKERPQAPPPASKKAAFLVVATDMIGDFSVELLRMSGLVRERPALIVVDPVRTKVAEAADIWLRPEPAKVSEFVGVLLDERAEKDVAGVARQDIIDAKKMMAGRDVYLLYNPANNFSFRNGKEKAVHAVPVFFYANMNKCTAFDCFDPAILALKNPFDCLYLIGETPKVASPSKTTIVQDCFLPDFDYDLFLPSAMPGEYDGSFVDQQGKVKKVHKAVEPAGQARPDDWIVREIAARIETGPAVAKGARARAEKAGNMTVKTTKKFPYYLIIRENTCRFRSRPLSKLLKGFRRMRNDDRAWVNPEDAAALGLEQGAEVKLTSDRFSIPIRIRISENIMKGTVLAFQDPAAGLTCDSAVRIDV